MDLRLLLSVLLVYRSNFHVLHWLVSGTQFNTLHAQCNEYYDMLLDSADEVAEMLMRLGQRPVNYIEASDVLDAFKGHQFKLLKTDVDYDVTSCNEETKAMLKDILIVIEGVLATSEIKSPENVGIKSQLEAMHDKYDLECRYKTVRRLK